MGAIAGLIGSLFGGGGGMSGLMGGGASAGSSAGASAGGLMGGEGSPQGGLPQMQGGGEAMDPEQAGIFSTGLAAAQAPDASQPQQDSIQGLMQSLPAPQPQKEQVDIAGMNDSDYEGYLFEKGLGGGGLDYEGMTDDEKSRLTKYLSGGDEKQQVAGGVGTPGEAMAQRIGMSGMGASNPQSLPQTPGMGGLMSMATRGIQQVPYRSNSGLMGGY